MAVKDVEYSSVLLILLRS